ncbi:hypothetical protein ACFXKQ_38655, partial [Streptomyces sp. NPDC059221]
DSERDTATDDESASEAGNDGDNETNTSTTPLTQRTKRIHKSKPPARNDDSTTETDTDTDTDTRTGTGTGTDTDADAAPESTPLRTHTEDEATDEWVTEYDYGPLSDGSSLPPAPPPTPVPSTPPASPVLSAVQPSPDSSTPPPPPPPPPTPPPPHTGGDNGTTDSNDSSADVLGQVLDTYAVRDVVVRQVNLRQLHDPLISARAALDLAPGGLTMRELELTDTQVLTVLAHHRHLSPEAVKELLKHPRYAAVLQHEDEAPQTS